MPQINLLQEQKSINCKSDQTILEATLAANIEHIHACGGYGKCSTCRVAVVDGIEHCSTPTEDEADIAQKLNFPEQIRLACQTQINGDIQIRRMIADEVDMEIVRSQFSDESGASLGAEKPLTIVFTDIANYTTFVEKFPPYDIVHVLNRYFKTMNKVIQAHHGFISDVAGDGILAVFGNNGGNTNSVVDAVSAVQEMHLSLQQFNEYLDTNYQSSFGMRAGIHYGPVIMGPFDTGSMKKLAVIGDNVNMASRIETANKQFGTNTLLSEDAYQMVAAQYPDHTIFETPLKGKTGNFRLYELKLEDPELKT